VVYVGYYTKVAYALDLALTSGAIARLLPICYILLAEKTLEGDYKMPAPSKRDIQNEKRKMRNRSVRSRVHNLSKSFYRALRAGDLERAERLRDESQKEFERAASKGVIHRNKSSRKISRIDHALQKAKEEG
jgi:small subunit ribosomal protein S20